jgi:alanine racemase
MNTRPTWVEVSLPALRHNYRFVRDYLGGGYAEMMPVVKADAYGHGAEECAKALREEGASWFAVTCASEGLALRFAGIEGRILLLSGFFPGEERQVVEQRLTPAVWDRPHLDALESVAGSKRSKKTFKAVPTEQLSRIPVHIKVDTGMGRLGIQVEEVPALLHHLRRLKHIQLEGVFSHYASAEVIDSPEGEAQEKRFEEALKIVQDAGFDPAYVHMGNSAGFIHMKSLHFPIGKAMVRPGIALYGYALPILTAAGNRVAGFALGAPPLRAVPGNLGTSGSSRRLERQQWAEKLRQSYKLDDEERQELMEEFRHSHSLRPVLTWKTRVMQAKRVPIGQALGYNGTFVTKRPSVIAALAVGYGDGLNRLLSNKGRVIVRDSYAPIVGRVSMDVTLIDVTDIEGVSVGDEVLIIGRSEHCRIDAWEHAYHCGTIPYEILCNISKRVPRVHVQE